MTPTLPGRLLVLLALAGSITLVPAAQNAKEPKLITNTIGMKLALVPAGEFLMGPPDSDQQAQANEKPQHKVRIARAFYLGVTEVTVGQFRAVVDAEKYKTSAESGQQGGWGFNPRSGQFEQKPEFTWKNTGFEQTDSHPVANVSWLDAAAFCQWLSIKEGKTYRLPTEAEWEYACRAGTTTRFHGGDDAESLKGVANLGDAALKDKIGAADPQAKYHPWNDGYPFAAPVGRFKPNGFGLYDMHGNVWEWCADWYDKGYYVKSAATDPAGPESGAEHVFRGGGWRRMAFDARCAVRHGDTPAHRYVNHGFRVAQVQE